MTFPESYKYDFIISVCLKCYNTKCHNTKCYNTNCYNTKCYNTNCYNTKCYNTKCYNTKITTSTTIIYYKSTRIYYKNYHNKYYENTTMNSAKNTIKFTSTTEAICGIFNIVVIQTSLKNPQKYHNIRSKYIAKYVVILWYFFLRIQSSVKHS